METVTISTTNQVTIPKGIREQFKLVPGQKLIAVARDKHFELIPVPSTIAETRGMLRGMDTSVERDGDRV